MSLIKILATLAIITFVALEILLCIFPSITPVELFAAIIAINLLIIQLLVVIFPKSKPILTKISSVIIYIVLGIAATLKFAIPEYGLEGILLVIAVWIIMIIQIIRVIEN